MIEKNKIFTLSGLIAPIIFASFVWLGGSLRTDYSVVSHTISALNQRGAPNKTLLDGGFALSYICMALFGYGLFRNGRRASDKYRYLIGVLLILSGVICFLMILMFPADQDYSAPTFAGKMHHVTAVIMVVLAIMMIRFSELEFKQSKWFKIYSLGSIIIIFAASFATAVSGIMAVRLEGLLERVSIGTFLQWIFVMSLNEFRGSMFSVKNDYKEKIGPI
ncbi:MAG: hypothetical protein A2044_00190 [Candidatus Firestonebacteria bacterium GWA2_43_8]|nr:MAG: hypothetical protein A2044_00190 [Candidatus Firestonebacteria bacterium GWA2_43_8]